MLRPLIVAAAGILAVAPAAVAQDSIKIAVIGPMAFAQGENAWAGAEMARDEINKQGGISVGGKKLKIELVRVDSNEIQSVSDATNAMERAITREKADVVIGGFRSEAVLAMQEVAMDYKKLFLGAGAAHSKLGANVEANYDRYKYWFRITPVKDVDLARSVFAILSSVAQQIRTEPLMMEPRLAAVPAGTPLAARARLTLGDLAGHPVVLNTVSGTTTIDLWPASIRPEATIEVANTDDWLAAIAAGKAVGVTTTATASVHPYPGIAYRPLARG